MKQNRKEISSIDDQCLSAGAVNRLSDSQITKCTEAYSERNKNNNNYNSLSHKLFLTTFSAFIIFFSIDLDVNIKKQLTDASIWHLKYLAFKFL